MIIALVAAMAWAVMQPPTRDSAPVPRVVLAPKAPADAWLGVDKVEHFFLAGFTLAGSFAVARAAGADRRAGLAIATVPTAAIAIGKEAYDRRAGRPFSRRDLVADVLGAAAYAVLLARTTR